MRQIAIFIAVGSAAALTHLTVVAVVVELFGLQPLAANVIGFCVAFLVSFTGHARFTFPHLARPFRRGAHPLLRCRLHRFRPQPGRLCGSACISSGRATIFPSLPLFFSASAVATFLLSKLWAFAQPQG